MHAMIEKFHDNLREKDDTTVAYIYTSFICNSSKKE